MPHLSCGSFWNNRFTVLFVSTGQQSHTRSAESLKRVAVACSIHSPHTGGADESLSLRHWSLISPGMKIRRVHPASFLSRCLSSVCAHFHLSMFVFVLYLWNGRLVRRTPRFPSDWLCFSLCLLFLCALKQKLSFGMAYQLLSHFMPFSVEASYLFILNPLIFWVVQKKSFYQHWSKQQLRKVRKHKC